MSDETRCYGCGGPAAKQQWFVQSGTLWLLTCSRSGRKAIDCPGERRSGKDRRAPPSEETDPSVLMADAIAEGRTCERRTFGPSAFEGAGRERTLQTEDGTLDLGDGYEAIYDLVDVLVDSFEMDYGDAMGLAIDAVRRYQLEPATPPTQEGEGEPECCCEEYWPGQGHPPDCPTRRAPEASEETRELLRVLGRNDFSEGLDALAGTVRNRRIEEWNDLNTLYGRLVDLRSAALRRLSQEEG